MTRKKFFGLAGKSLVAVGVLKTELLKSGAAMATTNDAVQLRTTVKRLNLRHTWTIARGSSDFKEYPYLEISQNGVVGRGEAACNIRYQETLESMLETIEKARPLVENADLWRYYDLGNAIQKVCDQQMAAKTAIDMALMDWIAKNLNVPLYRFLGLDKNKTPLTSFSIGIDKPEVMQAKIREAEIYPILKIKAGTPDDEKIMTAVRATTDKPLFVDANEGWKSKEEALEKIHWLAKNNVILLEQPMPAAMHEEQKWLRQRCIELGIKLPIIADESVKQAADIPRLAEAYDGINIKLMKAGGIQEALRMITLARCLNLKILLGCMIESSLGITAAAHLSPLVDWADLDGNLLISNDPFSGVKVENGKLILPEGPGLGVTGEF
jgi:L-alanine-DL-glutamate epimerase-like enolase superfamily enzyme